MKRVCNNCEFSRYTDAQKGYHEYKKIPLSNNSEMYCTNILGKKKQQRGYVHKGFTCYKFEARTSELDTKSTQRKLKEKEELKKSKRIWT